MEVQQLRHLLAVVEHGNLMRAAEAVHLSHSGLSRSIKSLEDRLGLPLVVRRANGLEPTIFGLSLAKRAKAILADIANAVDELKAIEAAQRGEVRLGLTSNYAHHLAPDLIFDFSRHAPDVDVTVFAASFGELLEHLELGKVDFVFGLLGAIPDSSGVVIEDLFEARSKVVVAGDHPLAAQAQVSIADLGRARWAMLSGEGFQRNFLNFFYVRSQSLPRQILKTNSIALVKQAVLKAGAVTVMPPEVVAAEVAAGQMVALDCEAPASVARVGLAFRADTVMTPQMARLIGHMRRAALEAGHAGGGPPVVEDHAKRYEEKED
jgi:DNA-binding transcriptional LysR family regulator